MDYGHWIFSEEFIVDEWVGFIYRIIEIDTGREYIGKKQFHQYLRKTVKGKKNKKRIIKESDWRSYTGSCDSLNQAIVAKGKENYIFQIESLHKSKGSLSYEEVRKQVFEDVLRSKLPDQQTQKYYNRHIASIKFIPPAELSEETRMKISESHKKRYEFTPHWRSIISKDKITGENHYLYRNMSEADRENFISQTWSGKNNAMFGVEPVNKGKSFEDMYGVEKSKEMKKNLQEKCGLPGDKNGMFGKKHTDETKEKWKGDSRRSHPGNKNGMFGKPCFYKMTEEEIAEWKKNISESTRGKSKSQEWKNKMSRAQKGRKKPTSTCPHCNKTGSKGNMIRYHFENCKFKSSLPNADV